MLYCSTCLAVVVNTPRQSSKPLKTCLEDLVSAEMRIQQLDLLAKGALPAGKTEARWHAARFNSWLGQVTCNSPSSLTIH